MSKTIKLLALSSICAFMLSGCLAAKVASAPFKVAGKTTAVAGKGVYHTGRLAGKGIYGTGKLAGKTVYGTGKGVYYMGKVPVVISDRALDTSSKVLTVTTQVVDLSGKVVTLQKQIQAAQLDAELANIRRSANLMKVFVDVAG